jgi:hypothetical protein
VTDVRAALLKTLLGEVGYTVPASGVTKYGAWFAARVGDPVYRDADFCALGQLWAADQVGVLDLYGGAVKAWAWVPSWLDHFRALDWVVDSPGGLVLGFMDWEPNGIPNHVLMCTGPASGGVFPTLEFNTRRDGTGPVGVWERTRPLSQALAFVRIPIPADDDDCWVA